MGENAIICMRNINTNTYVAWPVKYHRTSMRGMARCSTRAELGRCCGWRSSKLQRTRSKLDGLCLLTLCRCLLSYCCCVMFERDACMRECVCMHPRTLYYTTRHNNECKVYMYFACMQQTLLMIWHGVLMSMGQQLQLSILLQTPANCNVKRRMQCTYIYMASLQVEVRDSY